MKIKYLSLLFVCLCTSIFAYLPDSIFDHFPFENPDYIGYRMAISDLEITSSKNENQLKISYKVINTGRQDLLFGKKISTPPQLVVNFDHTLEQRGLMNYASDIRDAVLNSSFHIATGKISRKMEAKINIVPGKNIVVPVQELEELPDYLLTITSGPEDRPQDDRASANTEHPKRETDRLQAKGSVDQRFADVDENACSDLIISSIRVLKKNKKYATLEYTIVNNGAGPARIVQDQKKEEMNMALKAHYSTRDKMTKGSLTIGGGFVPGGLQDYQGKLYPGEQYTGTLKLNIQKMTSFTPYIILELDPYLLVEDCDRTNNKGAIKVGEGIER